MNKIINNIQQLENLNIKNYIKLYLKGNTIEKAMQSLLIENRYNLDYSTFLYQYENKIYIYKSITEPEDTFYIYPKNFKYNVRLLYNEIFSILYNVYYVVLDKFDENNVFNLYKRNLFSKKTFLLDGIYTQLSEYINKIEFDENVKKGNGIITDICPRSEIINNYKYHDINIHCFNINIILKNNITCSIIFDHDDIFLNFNEEKNKQSFIVSKHNEIVKSNIYLIKYLYGYSISKFYIKLCDIYFTLKNLIDLPRLCSDNILNNKSSLYYYKILSNFENLKDFLCILFYKYPEINDDLELKFVNLQDKGERVHDR